MEDCGEVVEGETGGDGVYAHAELCDMWGSRLREEGEDVGSCGGFLAGGYTVFEVVGYCVYGEGAGFLEEFWGGGGDCWL